MERSATMKLDDEVMMKEMNTCHTNYINCLKPYAGDQSQLQVISTSDPNGYLNYWDVSKI